MNRDWFLKAQQDYHIRLLKDNLNSLEKLLDILNVDNDVLNLFVKLRNKLFPESNLEYWFEVIANNQEKFKSGKDKIILEDFNLIYEKAEPLIDYNNKGIEGDFLVIKYDVEGNDYWAFYVWLDNSWRMILKDNFPEGRRFFVLGTYFTLYRRVN